ncbi:glycine rich protein, partial [Candidatus Termititenax persephonae]
MAQNSYNDDYTGINIGGKVKADDINNALNKMQNVSNKLTSAATNADSYASLTANSANHNLYPSAKLLHMVKGHLDSLIPSKANDSEVAHLAGDDEPISGQKHFTVAPTVLPAKSNIPVDASGTTIPATQAQVYAVNNANLELMSNRVDSSDWDVDKASTTKYPTCKAVQAATTAMETEITKISLPPVPQSTAEPQAQDFEYTGNPQTYTVLKTGMYRLEVWGAQGGKAPKRKTYDFDEEKEYVFTEDDYHQGGLGGYAVGNVFLVEGMTLYVYVGGKGYQRYFVNNYNNYYYGNNNNHVKVYHEGNGYNGGGAGYSYYNGSNYGNNYSYSYNIHHSDFNNYITNNYDYDYDYYYIGEHYYYNYRFVAGGGGATDIRLYNNGDYNHRMIVAGGGGGASWGG